MKKHKLKMKSRIEVLEAQVRQLAELVRGAGLRQTDAIDTWARGMRLVEPCAHVWVDNTSAPYCSRCGKMQAKTYR